MFNFSRTPKKHASDHWQQDNIKPAARGIDFVPFMEMSNDLMLVIDRKTALVHANTALLYKLGITHEELATRQFTDLFHEDDRPSIRQTIQNLAPKADSMEAPYIEFHSRMNAPEGRTYWINWKAFGHDRHTYCIGQDVTENLALQAELQRNLNQLKQAESIGRLGRWKWQIGEDTISWSDELYRIWDVNPDHFTPNFANMYEMLGEDDQDRMDQTLQRAVINKNKFDVDFCIKLPHGDERYIRCEGRCALDEEGDVIALYGIMQDMTEWMIYERQLKSAKETAERAYAAKTQFLANMSHELRTPLNAIIGFSEMIQSQMFGPLGSEKYADYAADIRQSGAHLLDLISDILDMSKIEAGKYDLDLEEVQISEIVETAIKMVATRAQENNISITVQEGFTPETIMVADRRACLQILLNILSNAVKFSHTNGKIEILCQVGQTGKERISIRIRDYGIGIPANKLATITHPFEQVSPHYTRQHEGSGLGLAITKELVEMHGGTLGLESQIGIGTTVTVAMPIQARQKDTLGLLFDEN